MSLTRILVSVLALSSPAAAQDWNAAPPNAEGQTPAFEGQTRAPALADDIALQRQVIAQGLEHPWGMAELPDGAWLVTERPGRLRHIALDGTVSEPITGLPEVDAREQGGLLDVILAPDFSDSRRIYWSFAEPRGEGKNGTSVATGVLSDDMGSVQDAQVIFERFRRGTARRGARATGAGLGLAIVKAIAEGHGGRVELRPTDGGGATFVLVLQKETTQ